MVPFALFLVLKHNIILLYFWSKFLFIWVNIYKTGEKNVEEGDFVCLQKKENNKKLTIWGNLIRYKAQHCLK